MIKAKKLEMGEFTKEDEEKMWAQLREVWANEKPTAARKH